MAPLLLPFVRDAWEKRAQRQRQAAAPAPAAPAGPRLSVPPPRQIPLWKLPLRRLKAPKPRTLGRRPLTRKEKKVKASLDRAAQPSRRARLKLPVLQRPPDRDLCPSCRPCPFVSCAKNNYFTETGDGVVKVTYPDLQPHQMDPDWSCAEDAADRGGATVEEVAYALNMTDERVRQITVKGLSKIRNSPRGPELLRAWMSGDE